MGAPEGKREFRVLGPFEARENGRALAIGAGKQRALLTLLLLGAGEVVSTDRLIDALWGESPPASALNSVHVYVSQLRKVLGDGCLITRGRGYQLVLEPEQLDLVRFKRLLAEGRALLARGEAERAGEALRSALALWRGPPLVDFASEPFAQGEIARLEELRLAALEERIEADLALGRDGELVAELEALVHSHPLRERLRAQLMLTLYRSGRQVEALEAYRQARTTLIEELGLEPGRRLQELERAILSQDARLDAPAPVIASLSRARRRGGLLIAIGGGLLLAAAVAVVVIELAGGASPGLSSAAANAVGLIDPDTDQLVADVPVGDGPTSVAFGEGAVWVANAYANTVSRIDPETRTVVQTISVGNSPSGIAVGGGGVWVANHDDGTVSWINPQSNTEVNQIPVGSDPTAVVFGYGSVWVTNTDDRTLSRIDPDAGDVIKTIPTDAVGRGIAVGGGAVWVTDESTRTVVRVDPATNRVTGKAAVGSGSAGIVYGDGAVWVANQLDGTLSEVDPTALRPRAVIPVAGSLSALAFDDGAVWVSDEFGRRVVRIDTRTGDKRVIGVGNRPKGLAVVPAGVWVAVQASGRGHRGGRLVVDGGGLDSIDPALAYTGNSVTLLGLAYDGLTSFRRVGGSDGTQVVPDLAAALPLPTEGGRSYTFRLRPGLRYSDGSPLRAEDFRRALERMLALGSPLLEGSPLLKVIGASRCSPRRPCYLSDGVNVNGEESLTFRLSSPDVRFPVSLTALVPVPAGTRPKDVGTTPIPSTGPYTIQRYVPNKQVTLVRNSRFRSWSQAARPNGYPNEIAWRVLTSRAKALRDVLDGKADVLYNIVPPERVENLRARYPRRLHLSATRATVFAFLNTRRAPFDNIRVRRALNYAVDRNTMSELHGGSAVAKPTCQIVPPAMLGYRRFCGFTVDPDRSGAWTGPDLAKARNLIAASGTRGERVVVWTYRTFRKEGHYFATLLGRLGYRAQLKDLDDPGTYYPALDRTPAVQAGLFGVFQTKVPTDMFTWLRCDYAGNWARFCDPRIEAQVRRLAAVEASDPAAGAALAARIDREIVAKAPWVPLFTPRLADFVSARVGNFQANTYASGTILLDQLWVR